MDSLGFKSKMFRLFRCGILKIDRNAVSVEKTGQLTNLTKAEKRMKQEQNEIK